MDICECVYLYVRACVRACVSKDEQQNEILSTESFTNAIIK